MVANQKKKEAWLVNATKEEEILFKLKKFDILIQKKANPKLRGQLKDLEDRLKEFEIQNIDLSEEDQKSIIDFDDMYESVRDDETGEFITFKRRLVS